MWKRILAFFCRRHRLPSPKAPAGEDSDLAIDAELVGDDEEDESDDPPPWAIELGELIRSGQPPSWAADLADLVQKSSRAQGRISLRLEEMERKLEGGFLDLQQTVKASAQRSAAPVSSLRWDELLDSMDLLDEAAFALGPESPSVAEGLLGVLGRLSRFLSQGDLTRHGTTGMFPDGRLFRVMGTEERTDLPEGAITRVIRAAVTSGDRIVREGAVITNRRMA